MIFLWESDPMGKFPEMVTAKKWSHEKVPGKERIPWAGFPEKEGSHEQDSRKGFLEKVPRKGFLEHMIGTNVRAGISCPNRKQSYNWVGGVAAKAVFDVYTPGTKL